MPDGHQLTVPAGFSVNVFADNLQYARFMALAPNGDVFLAEPFRGAGKITVLRDADKDGVAETRETFATGLNRPFGLAFWKRDLYVGNNDSVVRFTYKTGQTKACRGFRGRASHARPVDPANTQLGVAKCVAGDIDYCLARAEVGHSQGGRLRVPPIERYSHP